MSENSITLVLVLIAALFAFTYFYKDLAKEIKSKSPSKAFLITVSLVVGLIYAFQKQAFLEILILILTILLVDWLEKKVIKKSYLETEFKNYSNKLVIILITVSLLIFLFSIKQQNVEVGLLSVITVLVAASPQSIKLMSLPKFIALRKASKHKIKLKTKGLLKTIAQVNCVAFNKSGTLTAGKPVFTDILTLNPNSKKGKTLIKGVGGYGENKVLGIILSLSQNFPEHQISQALLNYGQEVDINNVKISDFIHLPYRGVKANFNHLRILWGNSRLMKDFNIDISQAKKAANHLFLEGKTVSYLSIGEDVKAVLAFEEKIKKEVRQTIDELRKLNIKTVVVTSDNKETASFIAYSLRLDKWFGCLTSEEKQEAIKNIKKKSCTVMMVGQTNDSHALDEADVGVVFDTDNNLRKNKGVIITEGNLLRLVDLISVGRESSKKIKQNIILASTYNFIAVVGGIVLTFSGITLLPILGAILSGATSASVVFNSKNFKTIT